MQIDQPPKNADSKFGRGIDLSKRGKGGIIEKAKVWFIVVLVVLGLGCISPVFAADADFTMTVPNRMDTED